MPASLDTIVTNIQNISSAISAASTNLTNINGANDFFNITAASVIKSGPGRIVKVSVIVAGSANGTVYDASLTTDTSRPIAIIDMSVGIQDVGLPVQYGIMIVPGSGMTCAGSYS